jgi:cellobiose phosphorylase
MIAEAQVGNGDGALDYYLRINPRAREEISEVHRCEPYVYAQMIAGVDAPTHGEAKNSWLTGTAAWNFVAATEGILGIRAEHEGLRVNPTLAADWDGYSVTRRFRGTTYHISVEKAVGTTGRVESLEVGGTTVKGNLIPLPSESGGIVEIRARIGDG